MADALPLFPLGSILVPGLILPLHIFEPRYRELIADLQSLPEEQREFGVVALRQGREVGVHGATALYDVGTIAHLRTITPLPDGRFDIVTVGAGRFRIEQLDDSRAYLQARVAEIEEHPGDEAEALAERVRADFTDYRELVGGAESGDLPTDPSVLSYLVAAATVLDLATRQRLLEAPDDATRLRREIEVLGRERALIRALPSLPAVDLTAIAASPN